MLLHFLLILIILALDQASKYFIVHYNFPYILNPGIAFSIPLSNLVAFGLSICVILYLYRFIFKYYAKSNFILASLGLIIGGAIGNMIDRIRLGAVIDFIHVPYFPSFNVADSSVTIGILVLLWSLYHQDKQKSVNKVK